MHILDALETPHEVDLLVAFSDISGFHRAVRKRNPQQFFDLLSGYYELFGDVIEGAGGKVIKFIGDSTLFVFSADQVDIGVRTIKELQEAGNAWLHDSGMSCGHYFKAHFGPVMAGPVGTRADKRLDVFGETVNIAAMLKANGIAITPQVFRKLEPETRKLFKKHTPPVTYIPVEERHEYGASADGKNRLRLYPFS